MDPIDHKPSPLRAKPYRIWIFYFGMGLLWSSCSPQQGKKTTGATSHSTTQAKSTATPTPKTGLTGTNASSSNTLQPSNGAPALVRRPKVSRNNIDDGNFLPTNIAVGLQSFMDSESPVVTYKIPAEADYVEILRCQTNTILSGGLDSISLDDLELQAGKDEVSRSALYRQNDFFRMASSQIGCTNVTSTTTAENFADPWAPSGSYRYLIRACVNPDRLTDTESQTQRNCSRQVGVSTALLDYTNHLHDQVNASLEAAFKNRTDVEVRLRLLHNKVFDYSDAIQECSDAEFQRTKARLLREAWVNVFSAVSETAFELVVARKFLKDSAAMAGGGKAAGAGAGTASGVGGAADIAKYYAGFRKGSLTGFQPWMDRLQLIGAMGGFSTSIEIKALTQGAQDYPRSCPHAMALDQEMRIDMGNLADSWMYYNYYSIKAQCDKAAIGIPDGAQLSAECQELSAISQQNNGSSSPSSATDTSATSTSPTGQP